MIQIQPQQTKSKKYLKFRSSSRRRDITNKVLPTMPVTKLVDFTCSNTACNKWHYHLPLKLPFLFHAKSLFSVSVLPSLGLVVFVSLARLLELFQPVFHVQLTYIITYLHIFLCQVWSLRSYVLFWISLHLHIQKQQQNMHIWWINVKHKKRQRRIS